MLSKQVQISIIDRMILSGLFQGWKDTIKTRLLMFWQLNPRSKYGGTAVCLADRLLRECFITDKAPSLIFIQGHPEGIHLEVFTSGKSSPTSFLSILSITYLPQWPGGTSLIVSRQDGGVSPTDPSHSLGKAQWTCLSLALDYVTLPTPQLVPACSGMLNWLVAQPTNRL